MQAFARGKFSRQKYLALRVEAKTIVIQAAIKGYIARKKYVAMINGFIKLQAHVRRRAAKKELKQLKVSLSLFSCLQGLKFEMSCVSD